MKSQQRKMKMRRVGFEESLDILGAFGNENYLLNHVIYFEKKLDKEIAPFKGIKLNVLEKCPNFAAWCRLYVELICNKAVWRLFRVKGNWKKIINLSYIEIEKEISNIINSEERTMKNSIWKFKNMKKAFYYILQLRHSFQHGGMPNPMLRKRFEYNGKILNKIRKLYDPRHYKRTKKIFSCANDYIELLPRPTISLYK